MVLRNLTPGELRLLDFLISGAGCFATSKELLAELKAAEMNDGGMGSLRLFPDGSYSPDVRFGKQASSCQFTDEDGVEVVASLNLDQFGNLYELDIWKTDFGKLIRIPETPNELRRKEK